MKKPLLLVLPALLLSACASLTAPSSAEIAKLPVVRYGSPAPADQNFVLYYPPGVDLPIIAKVTGSLLEKTDQATLNVRIKQGVYTYRNQVSFDGINWYPSLDKLGGQFWITLPGDKHGQRDANSPGELGATFNLK